MGSLNYGYCMYGGGHQINKALFNSISDTDVRKGWWIDENCYSANLDEEQVEFVEYCEYPAYTQVKFAPYKNEVYTSTNSNDIPLMRVEEMYLIKAEGEYMANGSTSTLVDFVQTYRDPAYTAVPADTSVQDEIWRQRRLELWGEGLSWFDLMRLDKGVDRRGAGFPDVTSVRNVPAGHGILLWRIPESEINANPLIPESKNNPAVSAPDPCEDFD